MKHLQMFEAINHGIAHFLREQSTYYQNSSDSEQNMHIMRDCVDKVLRTMASRSDALPLLP